MTDATAVSLRGLTKTFGTARGIADVSIDIPAGSVFGFLGPNGAGKSTTIRLLMGLYRPTAGSATVLGLDPWHDGPAVRRRVGYLPGELTLFPRLTGRETLDRFAAARGLTDPAYRHELVERFRAELDRPLRTLSKGNRQKVGLASRTVPSCGARRAHLGVRSAAPGEFTSPLRLPRSSITGGRPAARPRPGLGVGRRAGRLVHRPRHMVRGCVLQERHPLTSRSL